MATTKKLLQIRWDKSNGKAVLEYEDRSERTFPATTEYECAQLVNKHLPGATREDMYGGPVWVRS